MAEQPREAFVLDTSFLQHLGTKGLVAEVWEATKGNRYFPTLNERIIKKIGYLRNLEERGEAYCVPEVIAEVQAAYESLPYQETVIRRLFAEQLSTTLQLCEAYKINIEGRRFAWEEVPVPWEWLKPHIFNEARMPENGKGMRKLGDALQTDRHVITATLIAGTQQEVTCITRDHGLKDHLRTVIRRTIHELGVNEQFPFPINTYAVYSEETLFNPARKIRVYTPPVKREETTLRA